MSADTFAPVVFDADVTALLTAIRDFIRLPCAAYDDLPARAGMLRDRAAWLAGYIGDGTRDPALMARDLARFAAENPPTWEPYVLEVAP